MLYQKLISSHSTWAKVTGAVLKKGWLLIPLAASVALTALNIPEGWQRVWGFVSLSLFAAIMISACNTLTDIFTLLRRESHITRCQIWILIAIGIWLVGAIVILDIQKDSKYGLVFGLVGSVLAWIFQDKIKGAAAFLHIRSHKLIKIGDWIQLPGKGVAGEVKKVTLTTVTLCNWDTTTSTIPISALQQDHFINLENMAEGKTYGRQMVKNFILDTSCVRPLTEEEAARLRAGEAGRYIPASQIQAGILNARLFREYVHHYLMNNDHISHLPFLLVRWLDQKDSGMVLQIHTYLVDANLEAFEWMQSHITEHIVSSLEAFGLRMYQIPSSYDVKNRGHE